ncbi:MAG: calcium-binding protein [bacterium]|nr:calcium-binding protein [bacterium]
MTANAKVLLGLGLTVALNFVTVASAPALPNCAEQSSLCEELCSCARSCNTYCCEDELTYATCGSWGLCFGTWPCPDCRCWGATVYGTSNSETLYGNDNSNCMYGYAGDDVLLGRNGNDMLYGGSGDDELYGENGEDCLYGGTGFDYLNGGPGQDGCTQGEIYVSCERYDI